MTSCSSFLDSRSKIAGCLQSLICLQGAEGGVAGAGAGNCQQLAQDCLNPSPLPPGKQGASEGVAGAGAGNCQQLARDCLNPSPLPPGKQGASEGVASSMTHECRNRMYIQHGKMSEDYLSLEVDKSVCNVSLAACTSL